MVFLNTEYLHSVHCVHTAAADSLPRLALENIHGHLYS